MEKSRENKITKPKPSAEMFKYWAKLQADNNVQYRVKQIAGDLLKEKKEIDEQISEATIGYGLALKTLAEKKVNIEKEIKKIIEEVNGTIIYNIDEKFREKFGMSYYQLDINSSLTDEDVKKATEIFNKEKEYE